ncbi:MAG: TIGR03084 family metal-binding protein [Woeseiaceae bacterium]
MSFPEVEYLHEESRALAKLVRRLDRPTLEQATQFKQWRVLDVLGHLAIWNEAACMTYQTPEKFQTFIQQVVAAMQSKKGLRGFEADLLASLEPAAVRERWLDSVEAVQAIFADADPKHRVAWGGPEMSLRSCISARLMETWAHGQAVYDALGVTRENTDRLKSIAILGINTFGFNFSVNGLPTPENMPAVTLTAPSGDVWTLGDADNSSDRITGSAEAFCQVVTQTRNVADTDLDVTGRTANQWMAIAQCFAGPPNPPPPPGTRFTAG